MTWKQWKNQNGSKSFVKYRSLLWVVTSYVVYVYDNFCKRYTIMPSKFFLSYNVINTKSTIVIYLQHSRSNPRIATLSRCHCEKGILLQGLLLPHASPTSTGLICPQGRTSSPCSTDPTKDCKRYLVYWNRDNALISEATKERPPSRKNRLTPPNFQWMYQKLRSNANSNEDE